jgi:F420H(2)-dependent quinone reductase
MKLAGAGAMAILTSGHQPAAVNHRSWRVKLRARLATSEEKAESQPICDQHCAAYGGVRKRTMREIPIFVCEPHG